MLLALLIVLTNLFGYFKSMDRYHSKLRYFDWDGQLHLTKGKTGGQEGDPLEMLIFNLTIHHLWDRVLAKFQEARVIGYADDGYIKAKLSIALQVLAEIKAVFKAPSCKQPHAWLTLEMIFLSIPSALKVSLALVCLLAQMLLYRVLWLKNVGIS